MSGFLNKTRGWKLPLLAAVGLIFACISVFGRPTESKKAPYSPPPQAQFASNIAGIGVIEPKSELMALGTELPGIVRNVYVKAGDQIKAGAPLFALDLRDITAQIQVLQAELAAAKVQAQDASTQYDIVRNISNKLAVAKDDFNRRKFASLYAEAKVSQLESQLAQAETTRDRMTVRAPIDGDILQVDIRPGEYAQTGVLANPLIRMGDMSTLHVRVEFDEENIAQINKTDTVRAFIRGDTSHVIPLTFIRFEPYVRPKQDLSTSGQRVDTRVLQVIYALPVNEPNLFVGQQMDVFLGQHKIAEK